MLVNNSTIEEKEKKKKKKKDLRLGLTQPSSSTHFL
jgi:hypothetical protein